MKSKLKKSLKDKQFVLDEITRISEREAQAKVDEISFGLILAFFLHETGPIPLMVTPESLSSFELALHALADRSFSIFGFVTNPDETKNASFGFQFQKEKCTVFGYDFAILNSESPDNKDSFILCFLVRPPRGNLEILSLFYHELLEYYQKIRGLMTIKADQELVLKEMHNVRLFYAKAMLALVK